MNKLWDTFENMQKMMETFPEKFHVQTHELFYYISKMFVSKLSFPPFCLNYGAGWEWRSSWWHSASSPCEEAGSTEKRMMLTQHSRTEREWERERKRERARKHTSWVLGPTVPEICFVLQCPVVWGNKFAFVYLG